MPPNLDTEFPLRSDICYLNHAAVAPWPQRTRTAVNAFAEENTTLGAKDYPHWLAREATLREQLRTLINAPSVDDIALLKNTSEALSVVAFGLDWRAGDNIVSSRDEFPSNRIVWEALSSKGVSLRQADLTSNESPEDALFAQVDANTRMIAVSSIQYSNGLRLDLERIGAYCQAHKLLFCVDAIQSIGAVQFDVQAIHADFVMADGHKWMLGPEGLALFYVRADLRPTLQLQQYGWHMTDVYNDFDRRDWHPAASARRFECGSPNMLGIHALSASLSLLLETGMAAIETAICQHTRALLDGIEAAPQLDNLSNTDSTRLSGIVTFRHRQIPNPTLFKQLTQNGLICAQRGGGIRLSPHFYTPKEKLQQALQMITTA